MSVCAAITMIGKCNRMSELLKRCISLTGETSVVAAIALGCAAYANEYVKDIPQSLLDGLENGQYGRDYLIKLDNQLKNLIKR